MVKYDRQNRIKNIARKVPNPNFGTYLQSPAGTFLGTGRQKISLCTWGKANASFLPYCS